MHKTNCTYFTIGTVILVILPLNPPDLIIRCSEHVPFHFFFALPIYSLSSTIRFAQRYGHSRGFERSQARAQARGALLVPRIQVIRQPYNQQSKQASKVLNSRRLCLFSHAMNYLHALSLNDLAMLSSFPSGLFTHATYFLSQPHSLAFRPPGPPVRRVFVCGHPPARKNRGQ